MTMDESQLRRAIKAGPAGVYLLYGEESYLTGHYARQLADAAVPAGFDAFNRQRFDGDEVTVSQLEDAVAALPVMAEKTCVLVRDLRPAADSDRLLALLGQVPEECVLIFYQMTAQPDKTKAWQSFLKAVAAAGTVVRFDRKTPAEAARWLVAGAKHRGCTLDPADAQRLIEQAGCDLQLLQGELDKLAALAADGIITREQIETAGTKNLEARVFDLSKAILARQEARAYALLHQLFEQREEPLAVLGALSTAYADLYRARVARDAGAPVQTLTDTFKSYKGKEFRLRNALRDAARLSLPALRDSLAVLARADTALKLGRADERVTLEETVARLLLLARETRP